MTIGFVFWLLMLLCLLFGAWSNFRPLPYGPVWNNLLLWILLFLLGWKVFGWPIHG